MLRFSKPEGTKLTGFTMLTTFPEHLCRLARVGPRAIIFSSLQSLLRCLSILILKYRSGWCWISHRSHWRHPNRLTQMETKILRLCQKSTCRISRLQVGWWLINSRVTRAFSSFRRDCPGTANWILNAARQVPKTYQVPVISTNTQPTLMQTKKPA